MSFNSRDYVTEDLSAPKSSKRNDSESLYSDVARLNDYIKIDKNAKAGTAKEVCIVMVGGFRTKSDFGSSHAIRVLDPTTGEEATLWVNTDLKEYNDPKDGQIKHFVKGNFYGNVLTTFFKRVSPSVDEGYSGIYKNSDGEWDFDAETYYGKPICLIKKSINSQSTGKPYQVLNWKWDQTEYPKLAEFIKDYEDREEARKKMAAEAASSSKNGQKKNGVGPSTKVAPEGEQQKQTKSTAYEQAVGEQTKLTVPQYKEGTPEKFVVDCMENDMDPSDIISELTIRFSFDEDQAADFFDSIANDYNGGDREDTPVKPANPIADRALELFCSGMSGAAVSKQIAAEFSKNTAKERLEAVREAFAAFPKQ